MSRSARNAPGRFALIDALRGVAALSVVVFHIYEQNLLKHAREPFPEPFHTLFVNGHLGVYVFFVLSGFVIAYSIRSVRVTPGFIARFALRRSIRLDPPYWVAIAGGVILIVLANRLLPDRAPPVPSIGDVIAHIFYAQQFLGVPHVLGVFWTLCLEIQFYLAYVLFLFAAQRLAFDRLSVIFGPVFLLSLVLSVGLIDWGKALFLWAWPYFFIGVVTSWWFEERVSRGTWFLVIACSTIVGLRGGPEISVAVGTGVAIFAAASARGEGDATLLHDAHLGRVLQYLGRISYSLYLTHLLVGSKSARFGIRILGEGPLGYPAMIALLFTCVGVSIVTAHLMYVLVERPAQQLSQRIRYR